MTEPECERRSCGLRRSGERDAGDPFRIRTCRCVVRATSRTAIAGASALERSCETAPTPSPEQNTRLLSNHAWSSCSRQSAHRRGGCLGSEAGRDGGRRRRGRRSCGVRGRRPADGTGRWRLLPGPRRRCRAGAAGLLLRRPVTAAGADGRGADRLRGRVDPGLSRRRRRRSPFPGSSRGSPRLTRDTGGSLGWRCSSPRSSSRRPGSRCPVRSGSCSRSSSRFSSGPRRARKSTGRTRARRRRRWFPGSSCCATRGRLRWPS